MKLVIPKLSTPSNPYFNRVHVVQGDITEQDVDAVVTLIPEDLEYRGSLNKALLEGAGKNLDEFILENVYKPFGGDVYAAPGFDLPCKSILFSIIPVWKDDFARQERHLVNAVRKSIEMASSMNLKTLAIPPLGAGSNGFPKARAARLVVQGVNERLTKGIQEVRMVCPDKAMCNIFKERVERMRNL